MRAGATLAVRVRGARPDGSAHRPGSGARGAVAAFYRPGKDPEHVLADRDPDRVLVLAFDAVTRTYGAEVATAGWEPGTWTVRGVVLGADGTEEGWEFSRFGLDP